MAHSLDERLLQSLCRTTPLKTMNRYTDQNFLRPELIKQLIEKKADIEATRTFSRTPAPI
jgi:hypothetical protein